MKRERGGFRLSCPSTILIATGAIKHIMCQRIMMRRYTGGLHCPHLQSCNSSPSSKWEWLQITAVVLQLLCLNSVVCTPFSSMLFVIQELGACLLAIQQVGTRLLRSAHHRSRTYLVEMKSHRFKSNSNQTERQEAKQQDPHNFEYFEALALFLS